MKFRTARWRNRRNGLLFISPWLIGFLCLTFYPFIASIYYSFCSYDVISSPVWIGWKNYRIMFTDDPLFWKALYNTLYFTIFATPLGLVISIGVALLLNTKVKGMAVYRTIYYLPAILPIVASSIVWLWLLNPQYGVINGILYNIGIEGPGWLADSKWSKPALILMSVWGVGQAVLIYLASLQGIPQVLYESAEIDGARWYHKMRYITLPLLTPAIFFNLIIGMIGALQYFTQAYIMTAGGPSDSTLFYSLYLYNNAFAYFKMGYASAQAWILFVLVLLVTLIVFRSSARWVYYGGKVK